MAVDSSLVDLQNAGFEAQMVTKAEHRALAKRLKAIDKGRESTDPAFVSALRVMVKAASAHLHAQLTKTRVRGRPLRAVKLLRQHPKLDPKVMALIGARTVVDGISQGHKVQAVSMRVGARIEDELKFDALQKREPRLWRAIMDQLDQRGSVDYKHRSQVLQGALMRSDIEEWEQWEPSERAEVGLLVLDALMQAGLLRKENVRLSRKRSAVYLLLTPEAEQAIRSRSDELEAALLPWYMPMLRPPVEWSCATDGGYETHDLTIAKLRGPNKRRAVEELNGTHMPTVYSALNSIQATPWGVNEDMLVVTEELWKMGGGDAGLPTLDTPDKPARPAGLPPKGEQLDEEEIALLRQYKAAVTGWYNDKVRRQSLVLQTEQTLELARLLHHEGTFYFPHQLDYRGRAYAVPLLFNPQGTDLSRGMLRFAEGVPLGPMGAFWLAVHGANCWGEDKVRLESRADWVIAHEREILAAAEDPLSNRWWAEADAPFQFLAFCLEWSAYLESGESPDFVSHLPVSLDGSCNGLQHFSALLRDPIGADAVNLMPRSAPQDIYQEVASEVERAVGEAAERGLGLARQWLAYEIDRGLVKRQVMTTPYGASQQGMFNQLIAEIRQRGDEDEFENVIDACNFLTPYVYTAIGTVVESAREAMGFLQGLARALAKEGLPFTWEAPTGFPVVQAIPNLDQYRIRTKLLGGLDVVFVREQQELNKRRQVSASSPNFVHSLDAAHLMMTVEEAESLAGHRFSWAMVHDSFGTHAGRVEAMRTALRATFVAMYSGPNPLEQVYARTRKVLGPDAELPPVPKLGGFDVRMVLGAEFFFA